ncbi:glycosyltransferase family A protein [Wenyingzhuangia sp. IMCC45574]
MNLSSEYITVFIPTYNRGEYLPRLFNSLEKQTIRNFNVLIVDDGSTDNTEDLVKEVLKTATYPIVYHKKENGKKSSAYNYGIPLLKSVLTFELDSDDYILPNALETVEKRWKAYSSKEINMVGMRFLAIDHHSKEVIGSQFPKGLKYASLYDLRFKHKIKGDKTIVFLTEELKKHRFPIIKKENMRMSIIHNRLCHNGGVVGVSNDKLMAKEYLQGGITCSINNEKQLFKYPLSNAIFYNELNYYKKKSIIAYLRHNSYYAKFEFYNGKNAIAIFKGAIDKKIPFVFISILIGYVKYRKRLFKNR